MTHYTVRDTATMQPISRADSLQRAVEALDIERSVFLLNPPGDVNVLELVITADDHPDEEGTVAVHYAAGR